MSFKLASLELTPASGLDAFFDEAPAASDLFASVQPVAPTPDRRVIASLEDLKGFTRVASDTLIHQSTRDFWALTKDEAGSYVIERLIDGTAPVKG